MSETAEPGSARKGAGDADSGRRSAPGEKRRRGFPAPVTILTVVLIVVWIAAFFIPSGQFKVDASGSPVAGSFKICPFSARF